MGYISEHSLKNKTLCLPFTLCQLFKENKTEILPPNTLNYGNGKQS